MTEEEKYEVLEKIGHGSFGIIRKVRRKSDGHVLCRKEISYVRMSQKEKEQLQAELSILKELRHPNIVAYYEREHLKNTQDLHLYMEYCGNGDLGRYIKNLKLKNQYADEEFVWSMFAQLVTALYRCHYGEDAPEAGRNVMGLGNDAKPLKSKQAQYMILHRDLKPENVFLGADNSVKLGDFGLSKILQSHDFASTYVGTPFYMSPEICAAERYTLYSDIWSLGCIIYELCAREPPFNAKTHWDLIQKIKAGKIQPLPACYSPELRRIIEWCLKVNPNHRPDTVALLNQPAVKLMRKEQEVVQLGQKLKAEKDLASRLAREHSEKLAALEAQKEAMRQDIDATVRREWEVKARLEIDRQVQMELDRLRRTFEAEVGRRVQGELDRRLASKKTGDIPHTGAAGVDSDEPSEPPRSSTPTHDVEDALQAQASFSTLGEISDFPNQTDLSSLSLDSPDDKALKRSAKTPFTRARTMFAAAPSPMDVQMVDPSPMSIASLSLSPRRNPANSHAAITQPALLNPLRTAGNIFAVAGANTSRREPANAPTSSSPPSADLSNSLRLASVSDADDEGEDTVPTLPSPTRPAPHKDADPFKVLGARPARPSMARQKTMPVGLGRLGGAPSLFAGGAAGQAPAPPPAHANGGAAAAAVKPRPASAVPVVATSPARPVYSPSRLPPKRPTAASDAGSPVRKTAGAPAPATKSRKGSEDMLRTAVRNNQVQGRTLVELAQARAGRTLEGEGKGGGAEDVPVWDPERDEMPSPFLVRRGRMAVR